MRYASLFFLLLLCIAACSKDADDGGFSAKGVWVETTVRQDTINFNKDQSIWSWTAAEKVFEFRSKPFMDPAINPDFPINLSSLYKFNMQGDSIRLVSFLSSSGIYRSYKLQMQNATHFTVQRFYLRNALPETIEFVRIQ